MNVPKAMYNTSTECPAECSTSNSSSKETFNCDLIDADGRQSICNEPDVNHEGTYYWFTHIFLAVYLTIANIMLLNLLIAIFT